MSNYKFANSQNAAPKRNQVHPVMRGIGCIMMVIIPIISYIGSDLLISSGFGSQVIPQAWYGHIQFPPLLMKLSGPAVVLGYLSNINHLAANLVVTVVIVIVVGGFMSILYGYIFSIFGPPKYGPTDEPPIRRKVKRYKR